MSVENWLRELEEDNVILATCKILEYLGNVDKLLSNLSQEQQRDWELVDKLYVVYGLWSNTPVRVFYLNEDREVEIYRNDEYDPNKEFEKKDSLLGMISRVIRDEVK